MSDFIKEFNMTDFLGMMFPGSVLFVLFAQEMSIWEHFEKLWGSDLGNVARATLVIILGYVIGMLIHEIGDLIEKMLWTNPILNPRTYAVIFVGMEIAHSISAKVDTDKKQTNIKSVIKFLKLMICSAPAVYSISVVFVGEVNKRFVFEALCVLSTLTVISRVCLKVLDKYKFSDTCNGKEKLSEGVIEKICRMDSQLMRYDTRMTEEERKEKTRKQNLFDGFRTIARNLFILLMLLSTYSAFTDGAFSNKFQTVYSNPIYHSIMVGVALLLLLRYWHYSYLRFKYGYEDYLFYSKIPEESAEKECLCCKHRT